LRALKKWLSARSGGDVNRAWRKKENALLM